MTCICNSCKEKREEANKPREGETHGEWWARRERYRKEEERRDAIPRWYTGASGGYQGPG